MFHQMDVAVVIPVVALADNNAYEAGYFFGQFLAAGFALAVLIWIWRRIRR